MSAASVSHAAQDYLREIYKLQAECERVTTKALAATMGVTAPSASAMTKKLAADGLVEHTPYKGVRLTAEGERIALEMMRHHRLLELYLVQNLDVGLDSVHLEADRLEHVLSEKLESRIAEALGHPTHDPHGEPIPDALLRLRPTRTKQLTALRPGDEASVQSVPDDDVDLLRYLISLALVPGQLVRLVDAAPFGGPLTLSVNGRETAISREVAARIRVAA